MKSDEISEVSIDESGSLHVFPSHQVFPYICREAMEVSWSDARQSLYSPPPRKWTYLRWYWQILAAAKEQGCDLRVGANTKWSNIPDSLREEISSGSRGVA
jgi:hypothetical protein